MKIRFIERTGLAEMTWAARETLYQSIGEFACARPPHDFAWIVQTVDPPGF
jgi:hypothetical protein